ncbi:hypothetical protein [Microbacterium panaciterrae]|uniref:Uncharacterized protein n=1 Tax=Microbacterium panaciterrae TaxID=985759 RepID=A0ABP8PVC5_9MICO
MNTVIFDLAHRAAAGVHSAVVKTSGGLIQTGADLNNQLYTLLKDAGLTVILAGFVFLCWKKGWAVGGVIGGVLIASFGIWIVHGNGMEVLAGIWNQTFTG